MRADDRVSSAGMWSRRIAASIYFGIALTVALFIVPPRLLEDYPALRIAGWAIVVLCLVGSGYEWWWRKDEVAPGAEPDVLLELQTQRKRADSYEAVSLLAYNDSADATAMHVEIATMSSGNWHAGYYGGDDATPAGPVLVSTLIRFDPISHIKPKERAEATPILASRSAQEGLLTAAGTSLGLWWFVDAARRHREYDKLSALPPTVSLAERGRATEQLRRAPIDIPVRVWYGDREQKRRWERHETLRYDPATLRAYIVHGERREIGSEPKVTEPTATVRFECDSNRAAMVIRNDGSIADFWGTLRIAGAVRNYWNADLFCRWSHTPSARARIARGQECRIILAERRLENGASAAFGFSQWYILGLHHDRVVTIESLYSSTPLSDPPTIADDIVLTGHVIADPDLAEGIRPFRVILRAFEAIAENG